MKIVLKIQEIKSKEKVCLKSKGKIYKPSKCLFILSTVDMLFSRSSIIYSRPQCIFLSLNTPAFPYFSSSSGYE